jgi:hypothetical protein
MKPSPERLAYVQRLKALTRYPHTEQSLRRFNQQRAAEMAAADRRREPTPQLPLEAAA